MREKHSEREKEFVYVCLKDRQVGRYVEVLIKNPGIFKY